MKILVLSDLDSGGGAAVAAERLCEEWHRIGHSLMRIVAKSDNQKRPWPVHALEAANPFRESILLRLLPSRFRQRRQRTVLQRALARHLESFRPDAVSIHNLHWAAWRGWSPLLAGLCADHAPTLWTMHDMWSFTGRCAHAESCKQYLKGCTAECPTPADYPALPPNLIASAWDEKKDVIRSHNRLSAVSPSQWLAAKAAAGAWGGGGVTVIANGLPLDRYAPVAKDVARSALGISGAGAVLLMSAPDLNQRWKGGHLLADALQQIRSKDVTILTLGAGKLECNRPGLAVKGLGHISDERMLVLAYSAADWLVHPSIVDNLPNVIMEAMACGTPVIGFSTGGVPEMIDPGETGLVCKEMSSLCLAQTIDEALAMPRSGWSERCRAMVAQRYDIRRQASQYLDLFASKAIA